MAEPNSADLALVYVIPDSTAPTTRVLLCGLENVTINRTANTNERFRRDCAKPNRPGTRKLRVTGSTWSISGSGEDNIDLEEEMTDAFGVRKGYEVELRKDDGTDAGDPMGVYKGTAIMTARNQSFDETNSGTDVTLEGEGALTWTAAA